MTSVNTDIDNYSIEDILSILNIIDPNQNNVTDRANELIARYSPSGSEPNKDLHDFFTEAKEKVLTYLENPDEAEPVENDVFENIQKLWENNNKNTSEIKTFIDQSHVVLEQKYEADKEKSSEPIIATHIVNIDSQYRTNILPYSDNPLSNTYNTNFTFNLANPISKAINLTLYSYQLPTTWYAFNARNGNTFFMYNGIVINIPDGNYTPETLVTTINAIAATNIATSGLVVSYNQSANRISFTNNDLLSDAVTVIFFIQANVINYNNCGSFVLSQFQTLGINSTLGWLLGFRIEPDSTTGDVILTINPGQTQIAQVQPDTYGPKYFILSLEDYSDQRLTSGLYNITNTKNISTISVTDFYKTTRFACRFREGSWKNTEIYTKNAVLESSRANNNIYGFNNKITGPSSGSAFALIPLQDIKRIRPDPYVKFGYDLALNKRNYLSPTVLQRFTVRLSDDKGNLVNLYDNDWSFSLIVEERLN